MVRTRGVWDGTVREHAQVQEYIANIAPDGYVLDRQEIDGNIVLIRVWSTREEAERFKAFVQQFPESLECTIIEE
jgi:hypothetical protein